MKRLVTTLKVSLDPATSPAGTKVWDKQLKENYKKAAVALKGLGLTK